jgi:hypothetical protein
MEYTGSGKLTKALAPGSGGDIPRMPASQSAAVGMQAMDAVRRAARRAMAADDILRPVRGAAVQCMTVVLIK